MADYDQLTYCRLVGLYNGIVADTVGNFGDADARPDLYAPWMDATIAVHVAGQSKAAPELRLEGATPPRTVLLIPVSARVEGGIFRLPGQSDGVDGVEIVAKSALMGLGDTPLLCTVTFGPATLAGRSYQYDPVTFALPTVEPAAYAAGRVQILTFMGAPTGGSWRLLYDNITTPGMPRSVSAATLQTNLRALAPIGVNVTVVAGPGPDQFTVTFTGPLGAGNPSPLVAKDALTGGDNPWVRVEDAYTPVTLDLSTVDRINLAPSTPSSLVVRMIPDDVVPAGDGFQMMSQGAPIGEVIPLPSASWPSIINMPLVVAAGEDQAEARAAIDAPAVADLTPLAQDADVVHKDDPEVIAGAKTFTGGLDVRQPWGSLDLVNPLAAQYSAAGFKVFSEAASLAANPAGVQLVSGIADAAATAAYAELAAINRSGDFLQALVQWILATGTMKVLGMLDMATHRIANVSDPVDPQDVVTRAWSDARTHAVAAKAAPAGTDEIAIADSGSSFGLRKITVDDLKNGKLRTAVFQHEHCNNLANFTSLHTRQLGMVTVKPTRAWLHIRNWDQLGAAWGAGTLTNVLAAVGPPSYTAGEWNGQCSAVPTQILSGGTLTNNELVVSVPAGTYQFNPYTPFVTTIGWTCGTPQPVANGGGMHYYTSTPNDALVAAPAGMTRVDNQGFLDFYWEFEYANDGVPTIMVVGNSLSGGGNVGGLANRGILDAWHYQWAIGNGGAAGSLAVGGAWCNHFGASSPRWNAYSGLASGRGLDPDWIVFMGTSSSDIAAGTSLATAKTDFQAAVAKAKAMWPGAQMMGTTLPPRVATTAATEVVRKGFNAWISGTPAGLNRCMDIEPLLTDGGAQMALTVSGAALTLNGDRIPRLHPDADSGDHEHWRPRASGRIADAFNLARKAVV